MIHFNRTLHHIPSGVSGLCLVYDENPEENKDFGRKISYFSTSPDV